MLCVTFIAFTHLASVLPTTLIAQIHRVDEYFMIYRCDNFTDERVLSVMSKK